MDAGGRAAPLQITGQASRAAPHAIVETEAIEQLADILGCQFEIEAGLVPAGVVPHALALQRAIRILQIERIKVPRPLVVACLQFQLAERLVADAQVVHRQTHARQGVDEGRAALADFSRRTDDQALEIALDPALARTFPKNVTDRFAGIQPDLPAAITWPQAGFDMAEIAFKNAQQRCFQRHDVERQAAGIASAVGAVRQIVLPGVGIDARGCHANGQPLFGQARLGIADRKNTALPATQAFDDDALADLAEQDAILLALRIGHG